MPDPTVLPAVTPLGAHARALAVPDWEGVPAFRAHIPSLGREVRGKLFCQPLLGLTGMEASISSLPPGGAVPFLHRHRRNEELYVVLRGTGEFIVDGEVTAIGPGSLVAVAPEGARSLRCTGAEPLVYLCLQAVAGSLVDGGTGDGAPVPGEVPWPAR